MRYSRAEPHNFIFPFVLQAKRDLSFWFSPKGANCVACVQYYVQLC